MQSRNVRSRTALGWAGVACLAVVFTLALVVSVPAAAQTDAPQSADDGQVNWTGGMTLTLNGHDVYGPEPKITITRTPDTDEFDLSVVAGSVGTVTFESVGECGAVSIASFKGSGTFDEYGVFLVFTGTVNVDREFLCGVPAVEDLVRADWEIFVPITEVGLEGVFESFSYSMPGAPVPVGSTDGESEATSDFPDDFEGDEELKAAPPATPVECFLAVNSPGTSSA